MKTYTRIEDLPTNNKYLGSENGDGSMYEELADAIDYAEQPVRYRDAQGINHYFDLSL